MDSEAMIFRPSPVFRALYTAPLLLAVPILYDLLRAPNRETLLMLAITVVVAGLAVPRAWATVTLEPERLTLQIPLQKPRTVMLRQLIAVETSGRRWNTLLLRYHPMDERGRLDIANQEFLTLVPLEQQYLLEERLEAVVSV